MGLGNRDSRVRREVSWKIRFLSPLCEAIGEADNVQKSSSSHQHTCTVCWPLVHVLINYVAPTASLIVNFPMQYNIVWIGVN